MEIRLLQYFLAVTEELHFTKAAERLGISQPTLSQQIRLLEERLDTVLFHRNGKKIELTESGHILLTHVNRIFFELDQAKTVIQELKGLNRGHLRIGCSGNHLLYSPLLSFHKQHPNIHVSVFDLETEKTIERLLHSEFDLGIVFLPVEHSQIETIPLFKSKLSIVAANNHPLVEKDTVHMEDLANYPFFSLPKQFIIRQAIDSFFKKKGLQLQPIIELSDTHSLIRMAILNNGITILPKLYTTYEENLSIKIINMADPMPIMEVGAIYRKGMSFSSAIQAFLHHLVNFYAKPKSIKESF